jgi:peptidoglycan/xylan/chitin deacetylase (PgdA/CDA1 family)
VSDAWLAARRLAPPRWLTVLNYHRVDEKREAADVDEGVLDATPESLDRQLARLKRHFTPISLADLLAHLEGADLPRNPAFVTFDDGYRDNLVKATPILKRHGVRATFFISTGHVGGRRLYWWDRISWTLKHARKRRFTLDYPSSVEVDLDHGIERSAWILHRLVKQTRLLDLERFLDHLLSKADAPWTAAVEHELVERLIMTWDDVRALRVEGMDVGSHTRTHRVLQTLSPSELAPELAGSRADLESELGAPISAIAYPVGASIAGYPEIRAAVEAAGYRLGFNYGPGLQGLSALDPFDVRRLAPHHTMDDTRFSTLLAAPWIGA